MFKPSLSLLLFSGSFAVVAAAGQSSMAPIPRIKEIQVELSSALTGPTAPGNMKEVDVCSTDLGTMTEIGHRIFFAFGDTFGWDGNNPRPLSGINWRSNVFASTKDHDPGNGIALRHWHHGTDGKAIAVIEGAHQPPFTGTDGEQTKIPTSMVSVGDRIYLHYMSVHGFAPKGGVWDCNYSKFIYSDDFGETWTICDTPFGDRNSNFNMLALTRQSGGGNESGNYVYALGTPCGRFGGVRVGRVRPEELLNLDAWEYYVGQVDGCEQWEQNQANAVEVIPAPVGEGSILWNPGIQRWMYTYLNESTASIELREAEHPWGPWSVPTVVTTAKAYPQLYGAFMTPSFLKDDGKTLYFVMSMFGPYNTFLMRARLIIADDNSRIPDKRR
jgi:hypothetical protein